MPQRGKIVTDSLLDDLFSLDPYSFYEEQRDEILLPIFRKQVSDAMNNPHIRSMFGKLHVIPSEISSVEEIPVVPVSMFKSFDLKTKPSEEILKTLRSSGTTGQVPSSIPLDKPTMLYQTRALTSILGSFLGKQRRMFLVIDHEGINSPIHDFTARTAGVRGLSLYARQIRYLLKEVDGELILDNGVIEEISGFDPDQQIYSFGFTYIIWSVFVKEMKKRGLTLPFHNLTLFHSGGWKKLTEQAVDKQVFSEGVSSILGMDGSRVIDFYGMAEQTGIIFPDCPYGNKHVPIFAKIIIRDIQTLHPCEVGQPGLIEVMSILAQSYYGQAILTEDIGVMEGLDGCPCGRRGMFFRFLHRAEQAEVRGCGDTFRMS